MGRPKAAQLHALALKQGWLDLSQTLPPNDVLESFLQLPRCKQPSQSLAKPFADQICTWANEGIQITTPHQTLVKRYGFTGSYDSVRRLFKSHQKSAPATTFFIEHPSAETAQIDFGAGPVITDAHTGEVMKTWFFVMTLSCSKRMCAELVTNQRVETWLGCTVWLSSISAARHSRQSSTTPSAPSPPPATTSQKSCGLMSSLPRATPCWSSHAFRVTAKKGRRRIEHQIRQK